MKERRIPDGALSAKRTPVNPPAPTRLAPLTPRPDCGETPVGSGEGELAEKASALLTALDTAEKLAVDSQEQEANVNRVLTATARDLRDALKRDALSSQLDPPVPVLSWEQMEAFIDALPGPLTVTDRQRMPDRPNGERGGLYPHRRRDLTRDEIRGALTNALEAALATQPNTEAGG